MILYDLYIFFSILQQNPFSVMLELHEFTKDNIPEYMGFVLDSYQQNPFHIKDSIHDQAFRENTKKLITLFIQAAERVNQRRKSKFVFNNFSKIDGVMVSASFTCDVAELVSVVREQMHGADLQYLPYDFLRQFGPGEGIYCTKGAVRKEFMNHHIAEQSSYLYTALARKNGYQSLFFSISNPRMMKIAQKMGSEIISTYAGFKFPFYFMRLNLQPTVIKPKL